MSTPTRFITSATKSLIPFLCQMLNFKTHMRWRQMRKEDVEWNSGWESNIHRGFRGIFGYEKAEWGIWYLRPEELSGVEGRDGACWEEFALLRISRVAAPGLWTSTTLSEVEEDRNERPCITAVIQSYSSFLQGCWNKIWGPEIENQGVSKLAPFEGCFVSPWLAASGVPWLGDDVPHLSSYRFPLHMSVSMSKVSLFRKDSVISD